MVGGVRKALGKGLVDQGAERTPSRSSCATASRIPTAPPRSPRGLILYDKVDLMLVASTPETTNPVSDQCEVNGMPCISTRVPVAAVVLRRAAASPTTGFKWTYHFFWGLEDIIGVFIDMWNSIQTNKVVGRAWPNDGDGNAWGDKERGFPPALAKAGYTLVDPGRYPNLTDDFSAPDRRPSRTRRSRSSPACRSRPT